MIALGAINPNEPQKEYEIRDQIDKHNVTLDLVGNEAVIVRGNFDINQL